MTWREAAPERTHSELILPRSSPTGERQEAGEVSGWVPIAMEGRGGRCKGTGRMTKGRGSAGPLSMPTSAQIFWWQLNQTSQWQGFTGIVRCPSLVSDWTLPKGGAVMPMSD